LSCARQFLAGADHAARRGCAGVLCGLLLAVFALTSAQPAEATHYRYGKITWTPAGGNTIEFTIENSWRRSGYSTGNNSCHNTAVAGAPTIPCTGPGGLPAVGDVIEEDIGLNGGTRFNPGDGTGLIGSPVGGLLYLVTAVDPTNDLLIGVALDPASLPGPPDTTISHTYAATGNFTAFIATCCRVSASGGHVNNADGDYRIETRVNVGTGNHSPVSTMPPIVQCPINGVCALQIPGTDLDNDTLRFRLSTAAEAGSGFTQPGPPDAPNASSINANTGLFSWNTTGALLGSPRTLYSTQVMIEDLTGPGGSVKSRVPVDFFIQLVAQAGTAPVFVHPPTPACGSIIGVSPFDNVSFTVQASDTDALQLVTLNVSGKPGGATMTPGLPIVANPVSATFSWTPNTNDAGQHVMVFSATDDALLQSLCSITIEVSSCQSNADCEDGEICTVNTCAPGSPGADPGGCLSAPLSCDDSNGCTDDTCVNGQGCLNANNTAPCSDGDFCTVNDACSGGACDGSQRDCSSESDQCNLGICNEATDACEPQPSNEGGGCNDGLFCTVNDLCTGGTCNGTARDCSASGGACAVGQCDESSDTCESSPINEGGSCNDGQFCTVNETCTAGVCGGGTARDCSDVLACTSDGCDENTNICSHTFIGNCCGNGVVESPEQCDDSNTISGDGCEADCTLSVECKNYEPSGTPSELFVGACGAPTFATINAAVAAAQDGDIVSVCPGTYAEAVVLSKAITLRSTAGAATTIVQSSGIGISIRRSGTTVQGFTVQSGTTAIDANQICPLGQTSCANPGERGSNVTIADNVIENAGVGIAWHGKIDCASITGNALADNGRQVELVQTVLTGVPAVLVELSANTIDAGGTAGPAVDVYGMVATLEANQVHDATGVGVRIGGAKIIVAGCSIERSGTTGIVVETAGAGTQVVENEIRNNIGDGITIKVGGETARVQNNNIGDNGVGLGNEAASGAVDATENWWDSQTGPSGLYTGVGDSIVNRSGALTTFIEFLCKPFPQGFPSVSGICSGETSELRMLYAGHNPDVDPVGRYISFESDKDMNVDPRTTAHNTDGSQEIFLLNRKTNKQLGGVCLGGTAPGAPCEINLHCPDDPNADPIVLNGDCVMLSQLTDVTTPTASISAPRVTAGGKYVFFQTSQDLVGANGDGSMEVLRWSRKSFDRTLPPVIVDVTATGVDTEASSPSLFGKRILMESTADFVGENPDGNREIFVYDAKHDVWSQLTQTSPPADNRHPVSGKSGKKLAFESTADLDNDPSTAYNNQDGNWEVFYARQTPKGYIYTQVSNTVGAVVNRIGSVSKQGKLIVFTSDGDLTGGNADGNREVFEWFKGALTQITHSLPSDCLTECMPQPDCQLDCGNVNAIADRFGRFVVFESTEDLNGDGAVNRRAFMFNRGAQTLLRLSRSRFGENAHPRISNGRYVVWDSTANLTGQNASGGKVIYLFDRLKDD
jgi:hypothetical protein